MNIRLTSTAGAAQRVKDVQFASAVTRELGVSEQTLRNWIKASGTGKSGGAGANALRQNRMDSRA